MGRGITRAVVVLQDWTLPSHLGVYLARLAFVSLSSPFDPFFVSHPTISLVADQTYLIKSP
jgi:hypothetical protein